MMCARKHSLIYPLHCRGAQPLLTCLDLAQFWVAEIIFAAVANFIAIFVQLLVEPPGEWMPFASESNAPVPGGALERDPGQFEYSPFRSSRFIIVFLYQLPALYWHRVNQGNLWVGGLLCTCGESRGIQSIWGKGSRARVINFILECSRG